MKCIICGQEQSNKAKRFINEQQGVYICPHCSDTVTDEAKRENSLR